jgi:hypothetical protein
MHQESRQSFRRSSRPKPRQGRQRPLGWQYGHAQEAVVVRLVLTVIRDPGDQRGRRTGATRPIGPPRRTDQPEPVSVTAPIRFFANQRLIGGLEGQLPLRR